MSYMLHFVKLPLTICSIMNKSPLSELEQEVMDVLWELKKGQVRDILTVVSQKRPLAYTTVATILSRLDEKGYLNKHQVNNAFVFLPKITKKQYTKSVAKTFISKFFASFGPVAISSFAESIQSLPPEKKQYLLKLLEDHEKK